MRLYVVYYVYKTNCKYRNESQTNYTTLLWRWEKMKTFGYLKNIKVKH